MVPVVSIDQILAGMLVALASLTPTAGGPITSTAYARSVGRYTGQTSIAEMMQDGAGGRTPAFQVAWESSRRQRTTIGRRVDRVMSQLVVYCITDNRASRDRRALVLAMCEDARRLLGDRMLSLAIRPLAYVGTSLAFDTDKALIYAVRFETLHRMDYAKSPGTDLMLEYTGQIVNAAISHSPKPKAPTVTNIGAAASTAWSYALVGVDAAGKRTLIGPTGSTATGAAVLTGANFNRLAWAAVNGCTSYELHRTVAGGTPNTLGRIATTSLLTLDDTGLASLNLTPPDELHVDRHEVFA